ncbi:hypothetical protein V8F33_013346 [Rhypophila sp. PSN 637]
MGLVGKTLEGPETAMISIWKLGLCSATIHRAGGTNRVGMTGFGRAWSPPQMCSRCLGFSSRPLDCYKTLVPKGQFEILLFARMTYVIRGSHECADADLGPGNKLRNPSELRRFREWQTGATIGRRHPQSPVRRRDLFAIGFTYLRHCWSVRFAAARRKCCPVLCADGEDVDWLVHEGYEIQESCTVLGKARISWPHLKFHQQLGSSAGCYKRQFKNATTLF